MDRSPYRPMAVLVPHTPSPPSSPPDAPTPLRSGGSIHPWEAHHPYNSINKNISYSPLTPHFPVQCPSHSPVYPSAAARSSPPQHPPATSPLNAPPLFLKQELESEPWQTLYPSEIASFSPNTLRQKLTHSNSLLTRLSSSLSEARAQAAHFTFQHQLLTIETKEAMQRHQVEHEIAQREVEVLRGVGTGGAGAGAGAGAVSGAGAGAGAGGSIEQQRYAWALEEELAGYKRKMRRTKALLREAREEVEQVRGENEMLKRRIAQNRARRMRDFEFEVGCSGGLQREEDGDDDGTYPEEGGPRIGNGIGVGIGNGVGYTGGAGSSGPPTPRAQQHQYKYVETQYPNSHSIYQQPTPQPSSSIGNTYNHAHSNHHTHLLSSPPPILPPQAYHSRLPQTPVSKPRRATTNNQNHHNSTHTSTSSASSSSALTTLGLLASQVLSQESFPTSQTSREYEYNNPRGRSARATQQTTPRATTPVRGGGGANTNTATATTVPSTPISQARCHPGPVAKVGRAPKTPTNTRVRRSGVNAPTKNNLAQQGESAVLMATPKYTSPIPQPPTTNTRLNAQPQHPYPPQSSPPHHPHTLALTTTPRSKKRRLSSSSTLSLSLSNTNTNTTSTHDQDTTSLDSEKEGVVGGVEDVEEDSEEKAYLAHLVHTGSPLPRGRKRGKVLGGSGGYVVRGGGPGVKRVRSVLGGVAGGGGGR